MMMGRRIVKVSFEKSLNYIFLYIVIFVSSAFSILSFYEFDNKYDGEIIDNIFFIGDMEGFLSGPINCGGAEYSLSKLTGILKYYKKYSLFDLGDFSDLNETVINKSHKIIDVYKRLGISAINLTKKDFISMKQVDYRPKEIHFFSSNIDCDISKTKYYEIGLNMTGIKYKRLVILGVSDNRRIFQENKFSYRLFDSSIAVNEILKKMNHEKDFVILLFHDSIGNLKAFLKKTDYRNIRCIIGCYGQIEYYTKLGNLPIIYISARGKTIGHLILMKRERDLCFNVKTIRIDERYPEDPKTKRYIENLKNDYAPRVL